MKVEGSVAPTAIQHKIKVKEETKDCCVYQQTTNSSTSISTTTTTATTTIPTSTTTTTTTSPSSISIVSATSSTSSAIVNTAIDSATTSIIATTISPTTSTIIASPTPSSNIVNSLVVLPPSSTTSSSSISSSNVTAQPSSVICQLSQSSTLVTMVNKSSEPFPVDLDLKTKIPQVLPNGPCPSREKTTRDENIETQCTTREARLSPCTINKTKSQYQINGVTTQSEYVRATGGGGGGGNYVSAGSSGNESPLSSHSIKPENEDSPTSRQQHDDNRNNNEANSLTLSNVGNGAGHSITGRSVSGIFASHGKLKRLLGTLVQFATNISQDTGESVRTLVLGLLNGLMTAEEFHSALQEATNFPLRGFVLPYLRHTLPSLRRDLTAAARANNQTCVQYLRLNESAILETVSLAPSSDTVDLFSDHGNALTGANLGNQCTTNYGIMRSNIGIGAIQHTNSNSVSGSLHQHYSNTPTNLATKRRASDTSYYENGGGLDDGPIYGKRSSNPWNHHSHQQQQSADSYCWYNPLHVSAGTMGSHSQNHSHGASPVPPSLVQVNQLTSYGPPQLPQQQQQQQQQQLGHIGGQMQNGSSLDDEWKNIHVMLNCILGMVEKTKRALAILQRRGSPSPAATAPPLTPGAAVGAQNGPSNGNPSSSNGSHVESSTNDRDGGNLKRISGEIVAQTIRATEDRVAEVKRRAEEAVQEVKRAAVAEVQRAVAVAVAESRANERLRVHRLLDLPLPHRSHAALRQSSFIRVAAHINPNNQEVAARTAGNSSTPTTISLSGTSGPVDDEKDVGHMANVIGSGCWNCGRTALETCGGCGIARYCGSFCQHRDWEAGGHHATCNSSPTRERQRRSPSQSPTRSDTNVTNTNDAENNGSVTATVAK